MTSIMLIGDLASQTGLSIHTINYYIRLGLIAESTRSERSGYRVFGDESLKTLKRIVQLRRQNVPIKDIMIRKQSGLL